MTKNTSVCVCVVCVLYAQLSAAKTNNVGLPIAKKDFWATFPL